MARSSEGWKAERKRLVQDLGKLLIKTEALRFGTFTLSSGRLSSYYVDLRIVPSFPGAFKMAVESYIALIRNTVGDVQAIGGVPTAGLPYAAAVAYTLGKPLLYARTAEHQHGRGRMIEGVVTPGRSLTLLDDLVTTGGSLIGAAEVVRAEGGIVEHAVVLIDRLEGGAEELRKKGISLHSLSTVLELAELLSEMQAIGEDQVRAIRAQVRARET